MIHEQIMWDGHAFARAVASGGDPWKHLGDLSKGWHGAQEPGGFSEECLELAEKSIRHRLPGSLRRWYGRHAACPGLTNSKADHLLEPRELTLEEGVLTFLVENQGVWRFGISEAELGSDDPPVQIWTAEREWRQLSASFSRFALHWAVYSSIFYAEFYASVNSGGENTADLFATLHAIPLPDLRIFGDVSVRFHAGPDLLVATDELEYLSIGALSRQARDKAMSLLGIDSKDWDVVRDDRTWWNEP